MANEHLNSTNISRARLVAGAALVWERLWPLTLPLVGVLAVFLIVSWFGLWPLLSDNLRLATLGLFGLGAILALLPLRQFRWPSSNEIDRRLENDTRLSHRPLQTQSDRLASVNGTDNAFSKALWHTHQKRMSEKLGRLESSVPSPSIATKDPFALRSLVVLGLFAAFLTSFSLSGGRVADAFVTHEPTPLETARIDAWVKPPAYTNKPPLFLSRAGTASEAQEIKNVTVPEGSQIVVRILDLEDVMVMHQSNGISGALDGEKSSKSSVTYTTRLDSSGSVALVAQDEVLKAWAYKVIEDHDPKIAFDGEPGASIRGALEFAYTVEDDYGVTSARAIIKPGKSVDPQARPLVDAPKLILPLPGHRAKTGKSKLSKDISNHPWAGLEVELSLIAEDDAGQQGTSETKRFKLPGRVFSKPLAKAVVFERQRLALDGRKAGSVASMLDVVTSTHPETFIDNLSHYTALRVAYRHIKRATTDDGLREGLDLLWDIALAIEDGDLSLAERRLRDAQERLAEALERGASDEEIERLMDEMRQAMAEFMREMAKRFAENPNQQQALNQQNTQNMRQMDLDRMMQQIEDLAKSGSRDAARELLRQMQQMMNNMQMAQPQQNQQQDPFSQQMNKLSEMMRQQQELMDQTFDMQRRQQQQQGQNGQRQRNQGQQQQQQQGQRGQQQGEQSQQGQPMSPEEFAEAMRQLQEQQGQLQQQMQDMQQALRDLGLDPGERMGEAGRAMGEAEQNLGESQTGEATQNQGRALQAMRDGAQQMMRNMQAQAGEQGRRGERGQHGQQSRNDSDPLGRQSRSRGPQLGDDTKVPSEIDAQRAREILEAIRRRLGEINRPKLELDYLDRLLPTR